MDVSTVLRYRADQMAAIFDAARSIINRIEARWEAFALSRDPDFVASLREADEDLQAGRTASLAELEAEDRPLAF